MVYDITFNSHNQGMHPTWADFCNSVIFKYNTSVLVISVNFWMWNWIRARGFVKQLWPPKYQGVWFSEVNKNLNLVPDRDY